MAAAADERVGREQIRNGVRLAEIVVRGCSDLVYSVVHTSVDLAEKDALPFVSTAGCIVRLVIQHAEAVGENDHYVHEAGKRAHAVQVNSTQKDPSALMCRASLFQADPRPHPRCPRPC